jgi:putative tricarboxylic transport membrane protein
MRLRVSADFLTGVLFVALGTFAILYGSRYPVGTAARMGPGYFPLLASIGLILIGCILIGRTLLQETEAVGAVALRPALLVLVGTLGFGLLVERIGVILAGLLLVFAARLADGEFRLREVSLLAIGLVAFTVAIFRYGLGLPLPVMPF